MKRRILYLSQMYPYPPDGGGKIKTLNTITTLAKEYEIFAVFISEEKPSRLDLWQLEKLGIRVKVFYSAKILASVKDDLPDLAWHFIRGIPHYVFQYTHQPAFAYIARVIDEFQPDIIHVDHLNIAQYLPHKKKQVRILEHHNVECYLYWTRLLHSAKLSRKFYLFLEMILTYFFERKAIRLFDYVFAISSPEAERAKRIFGISNISPQPLVYPPLSMRRNPTQTPYILFVGNLGWPPNEDAVEWFLSSMFPFILRHLPNAQFHVVGKRNKELGKRLPKIKGVFLHGYQRSLEPFLAKATIFVLPFRMGGGLRLKGLTGLAAGIPVVSTPFGIEGLALEPGVDCLVTHDPQEFASAAIRILQSVVEQKALSRNAIKYIKRHHGGRMNVRFLQKYRQIIQEFL